MGLQLPDDLRVLFSIAGGAQYPEGDFEKMEGISRAWAEAAADFKGITAEVDRAAGSLQEGMRGHASDGFMVMLGKLVDADPNYLPTLIESAEKMAETVGTAAERLEYTQYTIIATLMVIALQMAMMAASAFFDLGISLTLIPGFQMLGRTLAGNLVLRLVEGLLITFATLMPIDFIIQELQLALKHRSTYDLELTKGAAISGVLSFGIATGLRGMSQMLGNPL